LLGVIRTEGKDAAAQCSVILNLQKKFGISSSQLRHSFGVTCFAHTLNLTKQEGGNRAFEHNRLVEDIKIGAMPFKIRFNSLGWFPLWIRDNYHILNPFYELLHDRRFLFEAFLEGEVTEKFGDPQLEQLRVNHGMIAEDRGLKEHPEANIPQLKKFFSSHNLLPITSAEL